ncbi:holo-ACP synthase [Agrococcus terreus]|uniref:Holo-[acyl-carrier-protein] synthase n=1 Tax=Agrococcus terreus TaxID=574649 RepID=A0ABQ2KGS9_9MICO|nr:holo-ACP synthase [Agrococcus terreus]GGN79039.1 holo-[acyl-carrier-protein] synthase [Agrococcus terreus]
MIVGLGVDVVDLARFERAVSRTPRLKERLFAPDELVVDGRERPLRSLAARFAAKEAARKALGATAGMRWVDLAVVTGPEGEPILDLRGTAAERARAIGAARVHVSMSHDAGVATATVIAES